VDANQVKELAESTGPLFFYVDKNIGVDGDILTLNATQSNPCRTMKCAFEIANKLTELDDFSGEIRFIIN
jgi:hypothetical protein